MPDATCNNCRYSMKPAEEYVASSLLYCVRHRRFVDRRCCCCDHCVFVGPLAVVRSICRALRGAFGRLHHRCIRTIISWTGGSSV